MLTKAKITIPIYHNNYWYDYRGKTLEGKVNNKKEFVAVFIDGKPLNVNDINLFQEHEYQLLT